MNIIFYGRTQMGMIVLSYLVAKGYDVKVIPEDDMLRQLCGYYGLEIVTLDTMGTFDLFICCHGAKIIPERYLEDGKFINMHSCLWKYKGTDPITRYIAHKDTDASIESHYMVKEVDAGKVITRVLFTTPVVLNHQEYFNISTPYYFQCIDETLRKI
jgi:methionyl-tRNA formyltransferase